MTDQGTSPNFDRPRMEIAPGAQGGGAPYGYGSNVLGDAEVHLLDYVKVVYKRRWAAMTIFTIVVLSVAVYTFTIVPMYEARTQILIEKESENVVTFKEAIEQNQITDDYYQTQYKILQSRGLARRTIESLNLWANPELNPPPQGWSLRSVIDYPRQLLGRLSSWKPVDPPDVAETKEQSRIIDRFLSRLTVSPIRNSRLVDVKFEAADPRLAEQVTNKMAASYIEQDLEFKYSESKEASDWLAKQLAEQRKQVESSEQALQRYREQTDAVSLEDRQNIVVQKLAELNAAVTRAKTERIQKETAYNQIRAVQNDRSAIDTIPAILSNTFIQQQKAVIADLQRQQSQLSERLGPNHPDMRKLTAAIQEANAKLQGETAKVVQSMKNDYLAAATQEQTLTAALDQQKRDALELNRKGIDYGVLQRDAATNRQIFDSLLQRTKETGISGDLKRSNIRVVDAAELPRSPAYPNKSTNLLLALFGGGVMALGAVFFFEYLDNRLKTPDEVRAHLGIPYLGMVPALFAEAANNPMVTNGVPPSFTESFRALRTNVLFSSAEPGGRVIALTSTGPNEGKTVIAGNLAIVLAQAGQRVLLMDGDMRKPRVHEVLGIAQQPGLSDVLVGTSKASEAVQQSRVEGLWVLPSGVHPPNPAELLGSKRFADFVHTLQGHFDWVLIDTPPVMAVTDPCVVGNRSHGVVFVVGAEMTSRHAAKRAVEQLDQAKAHIIGAILNRVDLKHHGYYYSQYYRREYSSYYAQA